MYQFNSIFAINALDDGYKLHINCDNMTIGSGNIYLKQIQKCK